MVVIKPARKYARTIGARNQGSIQGLTSASLNMSLPQDSSDMRDGRQRLNKESEQCGE